MSNKTRRKFLQDAGKLVTGVAIAPLIADQLSEQAVPAAESAAEPDVQLIFQTVSETKYYQRVSIFEIPFLQDLYERCLLDLRTMKGIEDDKYIRSNLRDAAKATRKDFGIEDDNVRTECVLRTRGDGTKKVLFTVWFNDNYTETHNRLVHKYLQDNSDGGSRKWFYPTCMAVDIPTTFGMNIVGVPDCHVDTLLEGNIQLKMQLKKPGDCFPETEDAV
jgi:hypothetical protein